MLKLELDWASDESPEYGEVEPGIVIEPGQASGPSGWPTVVVYAHGATGAEAGPRLWAWLLEEYAQDEQDADYLAGLADWV